MTRDEIIRLAIKCQLVTTSNRDGAYMNALFSFAALVAAAAREACAKLADEHWVFGMSSACIADAIRARGDA